MDNATVTSTSPVILDALRLWHEAERGDFERGQMNLHYDSYAPKTAKNGKRWIKLDRGSSGVYLIDKLSPALDVYSIKAYGVPNRRICSLDLMMSAWIQHRTARPATMRRLVPGDLLREGCCF